ncbi:MAG TPA: histidine--tRNA ligase [Candidatus Tyrphobacter sp.]
MPSKITAPRGTQDLIPPHSARWQALEARIHALARRFGYGEVRTPLFEATDLFVRGVGETTDIVEKEMYTFLDKGKRSMTLRPEWTAPVVRALLEHQLLAQGPQRLYYIGPIFRYERPQKGRYRQSHQFGVECTGFSGSEADVEVISLAWELVRSHGISDAALKINSIGDAACRPRYRDALLRHFRPSLARLSPDAQSRIERNPLRLLDSKEERDRPFVASAPRFEEFLCEPCREHFAALKAELDLLEIPYAADPTVVRGLDYYTRTVFEIVSNALGAQSAVCGGGRYDDLIASLGGPDVPAVGFALGMERFLMVVEAAEGDRPPSRAGIQAIALGAQARAALLPIVAELRRLVDAPTFMDYEERKLLAHLKIADRNAARFALIVGEQELAAGEAVLRDLESRTDRRLPLGRAKDVAAALVEAGK